MPRYFFHLYDDDVVKDPEGQELPDLAAARERAVQNARDMACVEVLEGHLDTKHRIDVADERGDVQFSVRFEDVVKIEA